MWLQLWEFDQVVHTIYLGQGRQSIVRCEVGDMPDQSPQLFPFYERCMFLSRHSPFQQVQFAAGHKDPCGVV